METNELMIGDWVIFHDSGYASDGTTWEKNRVCQIDSIDEDVRVKWYDESGYKEDWPHVSTWLLSPIPLTQKILEKNGFVLDDEWYAYTGQGVNIDVAFRDDNKFIYDLSILTGSGSMDIHAKYVHELQHALRLCGITHEIIL